MLATQKWEKAANIILQFRKINLFKNQVHFKFSRNRTRSSRTNIENCVGIKVVLTIVCAYQEVKNVCFSKNLTSFVFLKHPFFDSAFYLITDAVVKSSKYVLILTQSSQNTPVEKFIFDENKSHPAAAKFWLYLNITYFPEQFQISVTHDLTWTYRQYLQGQSRSCSMLLKHQPKKILKKELIKLTLNLELVFVLTLNVPCISKSCIEIKI